KSRPMIERRRPRYRRSEGMRRSLLILAGLMLAAAPVGPADAPHVEGVFLVTDSPAVTAVAGDTTTLKLKLRNYGLPPQPVALSVSGLPQGWKAEFVGGGRPVPAAMADTGEAVSLQLRLELPAGATGSYTLVLRGEGQGGAKAELPL